MILCPQLSSNKHFGRNQTIKHSKTSKIGNKGSKIINLSEADVNKIK